MTDQIESEHAELLADLGFYTENDYRNPLQTRPATQAVIRNAIDAIRALEAKVRDHEQTMQAMAARWETTIADRDRRAGEVEILKSRLAEQIAQNSDSAFARLTAELAAAMDELEQRREHMRRGMPMGVAVIAARRAGEGEK